MKGNLKYIYIPLLIIIIQLNLLFVFNFLYGVDGIYHTIFISKAGSYLADFIFLSYHLPLILFLGRRLSHDIEKVPVVTRRKPGEMILDHLIVSVICVGISYLIQIFIIRSTHSDWIISGVFYTMVILVIILWSNVICLTQSEQYSLLIQSTVFFSAFYFIKFLYGRMEKTTITPGEIIVLFCLAVNAVFLEFNMIQSKDIMRRR